MYKIINLVIAIRHQKVGKSSENTNHMTWDNLNRASVSLSEISKMRMADCPSKRVPPLVPALQLSNNITAHAHNFTWNSYLSTHLL